MKSRLTRKNLVKKLILIIKDNKGNNNILYLSIWKQKRFKDVDSRFKFSIFQVSNTKIPTKNFKAKFMIQSNDNIIKEMISDLREGKYNAYKGIKLNVEQIKKLSPIQESIIEFKDNKELALINKLFKLFNVLS